MHMKSILALSVLATTTFFGTVSSAGEHRHMSDSHGWNFLVGGSFGFEVTRGDFEDIFSAPGLALAFDSFNTHEEKVVAQQTLFGLLLGGQYRCKRWMFGLEGNVEFPSLEKNRPMLYALNSAGGAANYVSSSVLYERGNVYGLSVRSGYFVTPFFMPYVRLGAQVSRDELTYAGFVGAGNPGALGAGQAASFASVKKDIWGAVGGIGAEFPTYIGPTTLRVEYNFVWADTLEANEANAVFTANHKMHSRVTHKGLMSLVWNFL